jgi:hypothetical protein
MTCLLVLQSFLESQILQDLLRFLGYNNRGVADPWLWMPALANSWRTDDDIFATWDSMLRCLDNTVGMQNTCICLTHIFDAYLAIC